jgi:hypothetical protein
MCLPGLATTGTPIRHLSYVSMPPLRLLLALLFSASVLPARAAPDGNLGWSELGNRSGATVDFPGRVFSRDVGGDSPRKLAFSTADGASRFELFSIENSRRETPPQFASRPDNGRDRLDYKRITGNFIAASTVQRDRILYRRCNFNRGMIHCVDVRYPAAEKRARDAIVTRISLSLRPR